MFTVKKENNDTLAIVTMQADILTIENCRNIKEKLLSILAGNNIKHVIVDMGSIKFIDSSGLGMLIGLLRTLIGFRQDLALANMNKPVHALFELMRMHKVFDVFDTVDEARIRIV